MQESSKKISNEPCTIHKYLQITDKFIDHVFPRSSSHFPLASIV